MKLRPSGPVLLALGLVMVVGGIVYLVGSLDAIVKREIEQQGSRLLGTSVTLKGVDIDLAAGRGTIRGLRIANPEGFSSADAIQLESIAIALELGSLGDQPLRVEQIQVGTVRARLEMNERGQTNLDALRNRAEELAQSQPSASEISDPEEALRISIGEVEFAGGEILNQGLHTGGEELTVPFAGLSLHKLGGARGQAPGEIGRQVFLAFTGRVIKTAAQRGVLEAIEKNAGKQAAEGLRGLFE